MQLRAGDIQSWPAARNNSIIATKLVYPLCRNTFLPARAFQTSAEGLGRAGAGAGAEAGAGAGTGTGAGAGVVDTRRGEGTRKEDAVRGAVASDAQTTRGCSPS